MYYRPKRWIRYWLAAAGLLCFGLVSLFFTTGAPPKSASPNLRRAQEVQPVDRSLWLLASRQALHPSLGLPMSDLEIFKQCYVRRISSTHDIAAMVLGKPIVVIASTPTCRSSSGVQLACNARRVWLCTAPSRNEPTAMASFHECTGLTVQRSSWLGDFTERLDGLHNNWVTLLEVLIPCWYLSFRFCGGWLFHGLIGNVRSCKESFQWASETAHGKTHSPRFRLSGCDTFRETDRLFWRFIDDLSANAKSYGQAFELDWQPTSGRYWCPGRREN